MAIIVTNAFTTPPHGAQPGRSVEEVSIDRGSLRLGLLTLGAAIHSVEVPDAVGNLGSVHLRLPNLVGILVVELSTNDASAHHMW